MRLEDMDNMKYKKDIMFFAGAWKDLDDKEIENIKKSISNLRRSSKFSNFQITSIVSPLRKQKGIAHSIKIT